MEDEVRLVIEQALPRSGDGFEMKMQPGAGTAIEKTAKQPENFRKRAEIADYHPKLALLAHRQLRGVIPQPVHLSQEHPCALVKGASRFGQGDAIAAAIEQAELQLGFEIFDGGRDRGLRPPELFRSGLKRPLGDDSLEAEQLMQGKTVNHYLIYL
jgi:hypothetical protein